MPNDTMQASSTMPTTADPMRVVDQSWSVTKRLDDLQQGLTVALGALEELVRRRISSLVIRDDDS
jgi:hypothetical protein